MGRGGPWAGSVSSQPCVGTLEHGDTHTAPFPLSPLLPHPALSPSSPLPQDCTRTQPGYSLPQPHLDRTRLCELADSELDPRYLKQRDGLRATVARLARRKVVGDTEFSGRCAALLSFFAF